MKSLNKDGSTTKYKYTYAPRPCDNGPSFYSHISVKKGGSFSVTRIAKIDFLYRAARYWVVCAQNAQNKHLPKMLLPNAFVTDICPSPARATAIEAKKSGTEVPAAVTGRGWSGVKTRAEAIIAIYKDSTPNLTTAPVIPMSDGLTPHRQPHF